MNIYAIKDRLIDYFLMPFAAPSDKEVFAAISASINRIDNTDAIAQAPHHFEIWKLGTVTETGDILPAKEFLTGADSLIRAGLRKTSGDLTGARQSDETPPGIRFPPQAANGVPAASECAPADQTHAETGPRA